MVRPALVVVLFLSACGDEPMPVQPPAVPAAVQQPEAPQAMLQAPIGADAAAVAALTAKPGEREESMARLRKTGSEGAKALLQRAATGSLTEQGNAPILLAEMGAPALPALAASLRNGSVPERRIAVLALLNMGRTAEPVLADLVAARSDPDLSVRAAAEHAWKRASGDTSDVDRQRAEQAASDARFAK
jgi:hypothetical protein